MDASAEMALKVLELTAGTKNQAEQKLRKNAVAYLSWAMEGLVKKCCPDAPDEPTPAVES